MSEEEEKEPTKEQMIEEMAESLEKLRNEEVPKLIKQIAPILTQNFSPMTSIMGLSVLLGACMAEGMDQLGVEDKEMRAKTHGYLARIVSIQIEAGMNSYNAAMAAMGEMMVPLKDLPKEEMN